MNRTAIEWTDRTWNPVTGCFGPGGRVEKPNHCIGCYAKRMAEGQLRGRCGYDAEDPFRPTFHPERLGEPGKVKDPLRIFPVSMGDLFGDWVPDEWIEAVLDVVRQCPQHTFQFLTKNPKRYCRALYGPPGSPGLYLGDRDYLPNVWLGATVTNQDQADETYEAFLSLCGLKFISYEPLLEAVDADMLCDWAIIGAQTGPGAVPVVREHVETLTAEYRALGTPIFYKRSLDKMFPNAPKEFPE